MAPTLWVMPLCCGQPMSPATLRDEVSCLTCKRTVPGKNVHAERNLKPFDLIGAVRDDVDALYAQGLSVRGPRILVYVANPVDAAVALRKYYRVDNGGMSSWELQTAAGLVEMREDADHPRGSFTRTWRCLCGTLFANNDHRTGECPGCMQRRVAQHLDTEAAKVARGPGAWSVDWGAEIAKAAAKRVEHLTKSYRAVPPNEWQAAERLNKYDLEHDAAPKPVDPLDVKYDGVMLRDLLVVDEHLRSDRTTVLPDHVHYWAAGMSQPFTWAQRAAVSAHWSAELRAKVAASKVTERNRVTITHDED